RATHHCHDDSPDRNGEMSSTKGTIPAKPAASESRMIGNIRLTWVPDGAAHFKPDVWFPSTKVTDWTEGHPYAVDEDQLVCASIGALLVQTSSHTLLVDAGIGEKHLELEIGRTGGGAFLQNLQSLGVQPTDIDAVVYTHFHVDHIGWT